MALNHIDSLASRGRFALNQDLTIALISTLILIAAWMSSATTQHVQLFGFDVPPLCGFKLLTTWDCPGCGLTRALVLAVHGNFRDSYLMHIWGLPLLFILLFQIPYRLYRSAYPASSLKKLPTDLKKWISPAIFLSILLPWAFKTVALAMVRYL